MIVVFRKFRKLDFLFLSLNFEHMIDIRDISDRIKLSVSIGSSSLHRFELMKEDYISIVFSLETPVRLEIGDNVDYEGSLYYITDKVYPTFNTSNGGYDYTLRLESHYYRWKNHILFYDRQGNKEASWSLTRSPEAHLSIVVSNLRAIGFTFKGKEYQAIVDSTVDPVAKLVQYNNTNIIDALTKIAEAWECEWWVDGDKIYLGHLEHGEPVNLEIGKEISSMSRSQSQDIFATRLYAFGSSRNIPSDYRKGETGAVVEGVVQKRLMLPAATPYVDVIEGLEEEQVVEAVIIFEDIYPRVTGTITEVIPKEITDEDDSGDPITFTVYRFKDANLTFKKEYILPGQDLHVIFQTGPLSGMDFALEFNPERLPEDNPEAQVFEIVRNDTYGQTLPESPLIPGIGNKYILYNFDTRYVNDALIPQAEQELLERTIAYKDKVVSDPSTYTCSLNSYRVSGYDENNGLLNPEKEINLLPGQKVNLINKAYFENGRISRVIGFEKKLDIPYDSPVYTIGESAAYSRLGELEQKLDNIQFKGNTYVNQGGGFGVYIVKKDDATAASDENVFSALRTLYEINKAYVDISDMYLRKDIDDTAHGNILFDKKIGSSIFIDGWEGKGWEIQSTGAAILDSLRVRSDIYVGGNTGSPTFASGFTGWGWQIDTPTATGEMDNLFIRKTFTAYEIVYSQIYGLGGSQIVSDINKIARVEVMSDRYRCYMDDMDGLMLMNLRKGDGVRIQTRTGTTSIKYLFGRCIGVDSDYFDIAIPLIEGTGQPEAGDFALRWGNNEDTDRQGLIYLTTADSGAPFIDVYDGITDASTEGKLKARIGHLTGIRTQRGDQLSGYGAYLNGIYVENSTFILQNGDTIEQTFIAMNGKFESLIDSIRNDISAEGGNILVNSSFSQNTNYWRAANNVHFINVGGEYLWLDGSFYVEKDQVADIYNDNGQNVLRIRNTYILQQNAIMNIPDHTEEEEKTYSFSLFYKVLRPGSCGFGIPGTELYHEEQLSESDSYQKLSKVGKWNGKGDFELRFTGEILIYGVGLFADEIADAIVHLQTQITQNEEEIKLRATKDYVDAETGKIYTKYDTSLSLKADKAELTSFKEEYDEFQQVVRRDYATQSWTSSKIQTEVGSYVDGALVGYATTSWTSSQISSSVKGLASESFVNQTAEGLNININNLGNRVDSVEGELDSVTDITGAFYSFGSNKMRLNRRIEMGSGSNSSFVCLAGMSPDITGPAFWAGSSWEDRANSAIRLGHDGAGWLAKKNVFWDIGGNLSITGKIQSSNNGNRFVIDPSERSFKMINNSNSLVTEFKFDNVSGYQSIPALHMYLRNSSSGSTVYRYSMGIAGFSVHDVNGKILSSLSTGLILTSIPTIDPKSLGMVWRDGNILKISLG
nr:MAG TPA: tail protein [Caudoviricetes sp.]